MSDAVGRVAKVSAPPSSGESTRNETDYTYFDNGWAKTSTDTRDIRTVYEYDNDGRQTKRTLTGAGGSPSRTMTTAYWPDGSLKTRTDAPSSWPPPAASAPPAPSRNWGGAPNTPTC
ncbi:hypothetical protein [Streptomyces scopuliridis]|uniref:hypothetical protein n=1 Tax=Streptomyces scopuliridis TaxID=452529 RepID=UPI0036B612DC